MPFVASPQRLVAPENGVNRFRLRVIRPGLPFSVNHEEVHLPGRETSTCERALRRFLNRPGEAASFFKRTNGRITLEPTKYSRCVGILSLLETNHPRTLAQPPGLGPDAPPRRAGQHPGGNHPAHAGGKSEPRLAQSHRGRRLANGARRRLRTRAENGVLAAPAMLNRHLAEAYRVQQAERP